MKRTHLHCLSKVPSMAQSNFQIKLESTTEIIDRLLLVDRQAPWKAVGSGGTGGIPGDTGGGITDIIGDIPLPI